MPYVIEDGPEFWNSYKNELSRGQRNKIKTHLLDFIERLKKTDNPLILRDKYRILDEETFSFALHEGDHLFSVELMSRCFLFFFMMGTEAPYYRLAFFRVLHKTGPL